jgi:zinc and cadmium transporter
VSTLGLIIAFTLLAGVVGVLMASVFMLAPERVRSSALPFMVAFATGALLSAALLGLLPEAVQLAGPHGYQNVGLSLLGGIALFFILEKLVLWRHCHEDHCETHAPDDHAALESSRRRSTGAMVIIGDSVHNVLDGVLIAASFLIDTKLGVMTGIAVLAHEVPSEVGNLAVLLHSGMTRARALFWNLLAALGSVVGGVVGYYALGALRPLLPYALGVSAACLLYVAVADLIPGLHRRTDPTTSIWQVILIALGVALVAGVEALGP